MAVDLASGGGGVGGDCRGNAGAAPLGVDVGVDGNARPDDDLLLASFDLVLTSLDVVFVVASVLSVLFGEGVVDVGAAVVVVVVVVVVDVTGVVAVVVDVALVVVVDVVDVVDVVTAATTALVPTDALELAAASSCVDSNRTKVRGTNPTR